MGDILTQIEGAVGNVYGGDTEERSEVLETHLERIAIIKLQM